MMMDHPCKCGCGQLVKAKSKHYPSRPIIRYIRGHNRKGAIFTKAHRLRISKAKRGIKRTLQARRKQSQTIKKRGIAVLLEEDQIRLQ